MPRTAVYSFAHAARVEARAAAFVRTLTEIRALPELHDCYGHCSAHLRHELPYAPIQCDLCGHVVGLQILPPR